MNHGTMEPLNYKSQIAQEYGLLPADARQQQVEDQKVEIKSLMKVLVVGYKVTKHVEIAWLPIIVFHEFLDYWPHGILCSCYAQYHLRLLLNSTIEF